MTGRIFEERDEAPTLEVRVWRQGKLVHSELCESEDEAALVVEQWGELDGVRCEVDDLSVRHRQGEIFEPETSESTSEDYADHIEPSGRTGTRYED